MDWQWIIILGIAGTGSLLYTCLFVIFLNTDPDALLRLNRPNYAKARHRVESTFFDNVKDNWANIAQVIGLFALSCFAMYQVSFFFLGWMPSDWGNLDEYGEWATVQSSLSGVFSMYLGFFLFQGVHKGILATVEADKLRIKLLLRDEIDSAYKIQGLKNLKDEFSVAMADGLGNIERPYSGGYLRAIEDSKLNQDIYRELFRESIARIDKRFIFLRSIGVDTEG